MKDEMNRANDIFTKGAVETFYGDGRRWYKQPMPDFDAYEYEYMRTINEGGNVYLLVIDIDSLHGINDYIVDAAVRLHKYFGGYGILKASGMKGMHVIPFKMRFPKHMKEEIILNILKNIAYSAYIDCKVRPECKLPFLKRTVHTADTDIEHGFIDESIYTKSRKIRGFCRRFKDGDKADIWSVPVHPEDTVDIILKKTRMEITPEWNVRIPVRDYDPRMVKHTKTTRVASTHSTSKHAVVSRIHNLDLKGSDNLETIMKKLREVMPKKIEHAWLKYDPGHEDKFAVVCWMNSALVGFVDHPGKRIVLITKLIENYMDLGSYRDSGRFSPTVISYQVMTIVNGGYRPPKWIWDKHE